MKGLLFLLLTIFEPVPSCLGKVVQRHVIAYMESKWPDTSLVAEASEFMASESNELFWNFFNTYVEAGKIGANGTAQEVYESIIDVFKFVWGYEERFRFLKFALSIRDHSPAVEMHRQLSLSRKPKPSWTSFVDVHGQLSHSPAALDELLSSADSRNQPAVFPFDHIFPGSQAARTTVILHGDVELPDLVEWHAKLKALASDGKVRYVFRHFPAPRDGKVPLSGYSVELAIKSTEYRAVDDSKIRSKSGKKDGLEQEEIEEEEETDLNGFNIRLLKSLHPELKDKLNEFKLHLLDADELAPLKVWQLQDLSFQAGQRVLMASHENVLHVFQDLTQNFPIMARSLARKQVDPLFRAEVLENQEGPFAEVGLEAGSSMVYINGIPIDMEEVDVFSLLHKLKQEERVLSGFFEMGFRKEMLSLLYRLASEATASRFAVDYSQWQPDYLNNLDTDPQYRSWGNSVKLLLQPYFPGMIRPIARNLYTLVFALKLGEENCKSLLQIAYSLYEHISPLRIGLILATNPDKKISGYKDAGVALLNAYNFIKSDRNVHRALKFLVNVYEHTGTGQVKPDDVVRLFKKQYPDEEPDNVFEIDTDYDNNRETWARFPKSSGLSKLPAVLINGFPMADSDKSAEMFEEAIVTEVAQITAELQQDVFEGKLTEGVDVQAYLLKKHYVLPKLNAAVLNAETNYLTLTDVMERRTANLEEFVKLSEKQRNQCVMQSRLYLTKNDESTLRPVTIWVVADLETIDGRDLYLTAIRSLKQLPNIRLALVHNLGTPPLGTSITSLVQACLKLPLHQAKTVIVKVLEKNIRNLEDLERLDIHGLDLDMVKRRLETVEESMKIDSYYATEVLKIPAGRVGLVVNGLVFQGFSRDAFASGEDFAFLERYMISSGCNVIADQIRKWNVPHDHGKSSDLVARVFSLVKANNANHKRLWVAEPKGNRSCVEIGPEDARRATFEVLAIVDPLSEAAQKISHMLGVLSQVINANIKLCMNCKSKLSEIPLKRFFRVAVSSELDFNADGSLKKQPIVRFSSLPRKQLLTMNIIAPNNWLVESTEAVYDLDNIKMAEVQSDVVGVFALEHLLLEGHCFDEVTGSPPRGLQFTLGTEAKPLMFDTIVMANLGYFQLKANPGAWLLRLREGRSTNIYRVTSLDGNAVESDEDMVVTLNSFGAKIVKIKVTKKEGKFNEELLPASEEEEDDSIWQSLSKKFTSNKESYDEINIFSLASGHLYERFIRIMMLSVVKHTQKPVKFWLLKNYLSPRFKDLLPFMAAKYKFSYELVQYQWPGWLHRQSIKQRIMWGYKILFLDVLFPLDVKKIIFVDADQVVRTDMMQLMELDLEGAPYGYTPFCDSRREMEGYRFWKQGYWKSHLGDRKYHISALYVVDLKKFRQIAAGDRLRGQYHALSKDPNSLSNLDQDLPNNMIHQVKIKSLPQDWLWCETWCSDQSKKSAKTIDLCNNPMTKEPKLDSAIRIIDEWRDYDNELKELIRQYDKQKGFDRGGSSSSSEDEPQPIKQEKTVTHGGGEEL